MTSIIGTNTNYVNLFFVELKAFKKNWRNNPKCFNNLNKSNIPSECIEYFSIYSRFIYFPIIIIIVRDRDDVP